MPHPETKRDVPLLDARELHALSNLSLTSLGRMLDGVAGQRLGSAHAAGFELADYRAYARGDDLRLVDWNVYARLREVFVKVAPRERHTTVDVLLDVSRSMDAGDPGRLRYARRIAAALGAVALLHEDAARVWALGDGHAEPVPRFEGPRMVSRLVAEVAHIPAGASTDLAASARDYAQARSRSELVVLISDALQSFESLDEALRRIGLQGGAVTLIHVTHDDRTSAVRRGRVELRDSETGERVEVNITGSALAGYRVRLARFQEHVAATCARTHARYIRAATDVEPVDLLAGAAGLVSP
jgi:uncharacterized protein (DUF58 family)